MSRYTITDIIKDDNGKQRKATTIFPSISPSPNDIFIITTTPDPATANAEDEYGFSETITEWPLT